MPGVEEKLAEWRLAGDTLVLFTMRPPGPWFEQVKHLFHGYIHKPCADEYYFYDDHLVEGHQSICCAHKTQEIVEGRPYCRDCDIYLYPDELRRTAEEPMSE